MESRKNNIFTSTADLTENALVMKKDPAHLANCLSVVEYIRNQYLDQQVEESKRSEEPAPQEELHANEEKTLKKIERLVYNTVKTHKIGSAPPENKHAWEHAHFEGVAASSQGKGLEERSLRLQYLNPFLKNVSSLCAAEHVLAAVPDPVPRSFINKLEVLALNVERDIRASDFEDVELASSLCYLLIQLFTRKTHLWSEHSGLLDAVRTFQSYPFPHGEVAQELLDVLESEMYCPGVAYVSKLNFDLFPFLGEELRVNDIELTQYLKVFVYASEGDDGALPLLLKKVRERNYNEEEKSNSTTISEIKYRFLKHLFIKKGLLENNARDFVVYNNDPMLPRAFLRVYKTVLNNQELGLEKFTEKLDLAIEESFQELRKDR